MPGVSGVLPAAAAGIAFAADVSAKVQLEGNLFKYGADKSISVLDINKPSDQHWNPIFNLSMNGEKAGAEFVVYTGSIGSYGAWNTAFDTGAAKFKIWMSPIDSLKLIYGTNAFNLNQEHIEWSKSDSGVDSYGYSVNFATGGISFDLGILPGWGNAWVKKANEDDATTADVDESKVSVGLTAFKVQYAADGIGTVNAIFTANDTFKTLKFGAGYANSFAGINAFANFLGYTNASGFDKARVELYAEGSAGDLSWKVFPVVEIKPNATDKVEVLAWARADYKLGAVNAYLWVADEGFTTLMKDGGKALTVKPGLSGSVGDATWDVALQFDIAKAFAVSVPVKFSMSF